MVTTTFSVQHSMISLVLAVLAMVGDISSWIVGTDIDMRLPYDKYDTLEVGNPLVFHDDGSVECQPDVTFKQASKLFNNTKTKLISNGFNSTPCVVDPLSTFCTTAYKTIPQAVKQCNIVGMQFDYEWNGGVFGTCNVNPTKITNFTLMLNYIQRSVGGNFTVSADVGNCIFQITPWVDAAIFRQNSNLLINTMSYHTPMFCTIDLWKHDAHVITKLWKINASQVRLGFGLFSKNHGNYGSLVDNCSHKTKCHCNGYPYVTDTMAYEIYSFARSQGFRGIFPWAASYDSYNRSILSFIQT